MPATTTRRRSAAAKPAPEPEAVEDEFEDVEDDLEEIGEDDEDETPAPKTKAKKAAASGDKPKRTPPQRPAIQFGSSWLASHITEVTGETFDSRGIRMLLRKLAKDGALEREVGVTRERYEFTGPDDETVKAVVSMVKSGAAKELKQAGLQKVKDAAAAKKAAAAAAKAEAAETEDDEFEDDEDVVEEAPKPTRRRAAAAKPAPAKATPTTRRRAATTK